LVFLPFVVNTSGFIIAHEVFIIRKIGKIFLIIWKNFSALDFVLILFSKRCIMLGICKIFKEDIMEQLIKDFKQYLGEVLMYRQATAIMGFDAETVAPKGGVAARARRNGFFAQKIYGLATSDKMKGFLEGLASAHASGGLDDATAAQYRLAKKTYDNYTKIPAEMIKEFSELRTTANLIWEKARENNDFDSFAPYLEKIINMTKEMVEFRRAEGQLAYNVLLDDYEEGMTMEIYDEFFGKLRAVIVPLLKAVVDSPKKFDVDFRYSPVDIKLQKQQAKFLAKDIGYDLNRGYIASSTHPFCNTSHKTDVRITTRYDEKDFLSNVFSILHECGHAIYEQNIGDDIADTNLSRGVSMGLHESQSRFYENVIGRSLGYWEYITEKLKELLPSSFADITPPRFYEAVNQAGPSLIRVEADELTYSLHIMLRYEIEREIFNGDIEVKDLPSIWNKKVEEYLGITPPNDTLGLLQDIHWSWGSFGYFPTYALGSAYAAQFLVYMKKDLDVDALIAKGDFGAITAWMTEKIHKHGSIYTPTQLMERICGEQLNADYYTDYLKEKFSEVYKIQ
jgi:carboxypeptidase Taq